MWYSIKKKGFRMKEISIEDVLERTLCKKRRDKSLSGKKQEVW